MSILIVDDDPFILKLMSALLKKRLGENSRLAASAQQAARMLQEETPELMVLDIFLPDDNGFSILGKLRKTHTRLELPVIISTSMQSREAILKGYTLGANDYIVKPIDQKLSIERIVLQLQLHREYRDALAKAGAAGQEAAERHQTIAMPVTGPYSFDEEDEPAEALVEHTLDFDTDSELPPVQESVEESITAIHTAEPVRGSSFNLGGEAPPPSNLPSLLPNSEALDHAERAYRESVLQEEPIPCEMPVIIALGGRNFFCKTIRVSNHDMVVLAFEDVPRGDSLLVQVVHPDGETYDLQAVELQREHLSPQEVGVDKLVLKITRAPSGFDDYYLQLHDAYRARGLQGIQSVLKGDGAKSTDDEVTQAATPRPNDFLLRTSVLSHKLLEGKRYLFREQLGKGGFASVYLVKDLALKRLVAMKVLSPEFAGDDEYRAKFLYEAQLAAQFHHPNIVFVYEVAEYSSAEVADFLDFPEPILSRHPERFIYFTMQYVEGDSLMKMLTDNRRLDQDFCIRMAIETTKALEYAHRKGVVHRDIKPANIMITPEEHIIVTDFGIASLEATATAALESELGRLPQGAKLECTPAYASPEQLRNQELDTRSDIYSLGVSLFEALTGEVPFESRDLKEMVRRQLKEEPAPLRDRRADAAEGLEAIVSKCLCKKPEERYAEPSELLTALQRLLGREDGQEENEHQKALNKLVHEVLMLDENADATSLLMRLTSLLRINKTTIEAEDYNAITARVAEPPVLNVLLRRNLAEEKQQHLMDFFKELESSRAVFTLLRWFNREGNPEKKLFLARLAVVSTGRNLNPIADFGLELVDAEAVVLLRAFRLEEVAFGHELLTKWSRHQGLQTQKELLQIIQNIKDPGEDTLEILRLFADGLRTNHAAVHQDALELLRAYI